MKLFIIFLLVCKNNVSCVEYTLENSRNIFDLFKEKYNKAYKNGTEERNRFKNFVDNLNKVEKINADTKNDTFFILNQYADLNETEVDEHYGIHIKPYSNASRISDTVPAGMQTFHDIKSSELYNLDDSDKLFQEYLEKYNKNYTKKFERLKHYYRFVKTLVKLNRERLEHDSDLVLDETADVLKQPNEYMY